jgi:hypothetical protein
MLHNPGQSLNAAAFAGARSSPREADAVSSTPCPQTVHRSYTLATPDPNILWGAYHEYHQILWFWG